MANKTYYKKGSQYVDVNGKAVMIVKGNQLTFTDYFDAGGGGELPVASASTLGGVKVGDGLNVTAGGVLSVAPSAYSLEEVNTGKKWLDGKDIYRRGFEVGTYFANTFKDIVSMTTLGAEKLVNSILLAGTHAEYPIEHIDINVNGGTIRFKSAYGDSSTQDTNYVFLEYTKVTPAEPAETNANTRTVKKTVKKG